ncbi:hypothetical protein PCC8801_3269 [Rippkaea orientalis PCC 8801]|uniref:Uncharacterized protein n=1 Tax=Rippkaea orientalis (strain PCC 8801 / RF-1) TaxID=41431 RepID=B7JYE0_RIPO1|nr:hypothetical protein [Rippkaea orientalis]ACK67242.1 hypothetical protein PCC8801_3269 [Rippkaea orientalis PCC 8801]
MIISDINYLETTNLDVHGAFLPIVFGPPSATAYSNAGGNAFGRGYAQTWTNTYTLADAQIGAKTAYSLAQSTSAGEV